MTSAVGEAPSRVQMFARRPASWVHYATLLLAAVGLLYVARNQWFYFDEWDIIWPAESSRRFIEGHNGHWSSVPIALWSAIQYTLGLGSYLPFIGVAIAAHLAVAHLLWRVLNRINTSPWVATSMITVFLFFGAAGENLMWAFQMGFMGAMAFGLGALVLALRPTVGPVGVAGIAALLTLGAATAGTALPLFFVVGAVVLYRLGWRKALVAVGVPSVIYLFWYTFIAGPNPTDVYRAKTIGGMLRGIPEYVAHMFIGAYDASTPVPGFGLVVVTAIILWVLLAIAGRALTTLVVVATGMLVSGLIFASLTAYSRLEIGLAGAGESRYVYAAVCYTLPAVGLLLTRLVEGAAARLFVVVALIGVVFVFNVGTLFAQATDGAAREINTHELISAALDLSEEYPGLIDPAARPDPIYLPRTLEQLKALEADFGMTRIPYSQAARLTALLNVGLTTRAAPKSSETCSVSLQEGSAIVVGPEGAILDSASGGELTVYLDDGDARSASRTLTLREGRTELSVLEQTTLVVEGATAPVTACGQQRAS